jgi:hypothetical protein
MPELTGAEIAAREDALITAEDAQLAARARTKGAEAARSDMYRINLTRLRDGRDFGIWQTFDGADLQAESETVGGNGLPLIQLGGPSARSPITCSRVFYPEGDEQLRELEEGNGRDRFQATRQKADADGYLVGTPRRFNALLIAVKLGSVDVSSDDPTADRYTIELAPNA